MTVKDTLKAAIKALKEETKAKGSASVQTPLGEITAFDPAALIANPPSKPVVAGGSKVALSKEFLESLPPGASLAVLGMEPKAAGEGETTAAPPEEPFSDVGGVKLATGVMDLTILDADGEPIVNLSKPLLFKLPPRRGEKDRSFPEASCAFLESYKDAQGANQLRWSKRGVRMASRAAILAVNETTGEGVWCETDHLSIFAAILNAILGCTNLELLTPAGMEAIQTHEGWWQSQPATLIWCVTGVLLLIVALGMIREFWALKLGRTYQKGKKVTMCKGFVNWGPQVCKHKYAAFVVFARDIFQCMRKGPAKLRKPTLTQGVQRILAFRTGISTACVTSQCWNGNTWIDSTVSLPHFVLCHKLEFYSGGVEEVITHELRGRSPLHMLKRFCILFIACHPLLDATRLGAASLSVRKRCTLQLAAFFGVLATNAMIFNFSGAQRSWEAPASCPINPSSQLFIVVATVVSVILNVVPNAFLMDMAKQVYGRPVWRAIFWCQALTYTFGTFFVVVIGLANLNEKDQDKWFASLRWSLTIKFLAMPLAQCIRNGIMLEVFLREDDKVSHIENMLGLRHKNEVISNGNGGNAKAEQTSRQAMSAQDLVKFTAMLGEKVMLNFKPETSTSGEVFKEAIQLFCKEAGSAVAIAEITSVAGLARGDDPATVTCTVLHLGRCERAERICINEFKSAAPSEIAGGRCAFGHKASLENVALGHAVGFSVTKAGKVMGVACLPMEDLLHSKGFKGEITLHRLEGESTESLSQVAIREPPQTGRVGGNSVTGSKGTDAGGERALTVTVNVQIPPDSIHQIVTEELNKARATATETTTSHEAHDESHESHKKLMNFVSDFRHELKDFQHELSAEIHAENSAFDFMSKAYAGPFEDGLKPPDRLVVHSRQGNFLDLASALLADAMGETGPEALAPNGTVERIRKMLAEKDSNGVLEMLRQKKALEVRFWIDLFSLPHEGSKQWHEELIGLLPTVVRTLKKACCRQMIKDIKAQQPPSCALPTQLIVMDRTCTGLQPTSISETMLVKAMGLGQRMLLHPVHMQTSQLGEALRKLERDGPGDCSKCSWTQPFLGGDKEAHKHYKDLALKAVKRYGDDTPETLQTTGLTDTVAVIAGALAAGGRTSESAGAAAAAPVEIGGEAPELEIDA